MVRRDSLLRRNVAEHSFLLIIVSAHSLASWTFLTSDEFLDLKLQKEWVFQQTANNAFSSNLGYRPISPRIVLRSHANIELSVTISVLTRNEERLDKTVRPPIRSPGPSH